MHKTILTIILLLHTYFIISQNRTERSNALLDDLVTDGYVIGASGSYSVDGVVTWEAATGYADRSIRKKFTLDTQVRTASIAKTMTAVAVMQLVEQGLVDINLPIDTYIPEFIQKSETKITTKHLLSHTSGMAGYKNKNEIENQINYSSLLEAYNLFKNRKLNTKPGTTYAYSSYGYVVLGLLIEHVSGLSYETYMQHYIWDKADMKHTGIEKPELICLQSTTLYNRTPEGTLKKAVPNNLSNRIPGGGLYSTVNDLIKFGNALINNHFIQQETFKRMIDYHHLNNANSRYGLGFRLYGSFLNKADIVGHSGSQTGATTQLFVIPRLKTVIAIVANTSGSAKEVATATRELIDTSQLKD